MQVELQQVAAALGIAVAVGGILFLALRSRFIGIFADAEAMNALGRRVASLEDRTAQMPTEDDMRELTRRLGAVEVAIASTSAAIEGVAEGQKRIERMVTLIVEHELRGSKTSGNG